MRHKAQIILALDVDTLAKAKYFINRLYPQIKIFKIGSQLFTLAGPQAVNFARHKGAEVFLDLKFYDIPNTVANAVQQAVGLKVKMLTLHIAGGKEMLKAAVKAAKEESAKLKYRRPLLIGVTVLTSQKATAGAVLKLARLGLASGLDGIVCSVREAAYLRRKLKGKFLIVTPGIRPDANKPDDQKRTATVADALKAGSDFLVIGRPILAAPKPLEAAREILRSMKNV